MTLSKPETKMMERKMELATFFRERKDVLCCLQETLKKSEKDTWLH